MNWEKKILDTFIEHYFSSVDETGENRKNLRLRSLILFPDFDTAHHNEKENYLEAAESLERKEIIKLNWEKPGERLKTMSCNDFEKLFITAKRPYPKSEVEKIKAILDEEIISIKKTHGENNTALLEYISLHFGPREIGQGIDIHIIQGLICLIKYFSESPRLEKITPRALSILLFKDSKYLEKLLTLCRPLLTQAQKNVPCPDFIFLERSFPETMISGKLIFNFKENNIPLHNINGLIFNFPLESINAIASIKPISGSNNMKVLTIENKETFYALGSPQTSSYDCFLYTGGYPNKAVVELIKILAKSGFSFYHAGDLDPDGILILQNIRELAGKPVTPIKMNAATFDEYRPWA